jgi:RecA-family ATPase
MSDSSQAVTHDPTDNPLAKFSDVHAKPAAWLWPNWLPLGKLAILDGDPGLGKSTLLFDLAARVSSSGAMPDGTQGARGSVIILNAEDDPEDTIRPRLAAAGADVERVFHLGEVNACVRRRQARLPDDVPLLGRLIALHEARLLIVDPLAAFLGGVDANCEQHIRPALQQISTLARELCCTVICVRHLNKSASAKAVYRGSGSIGVIGHARTGLVVAQDPDDEEQRILAVSKSNLAVKPASLRFVLENHDGVGRISWRGTSPYHANQLVERPPTDEQRQRRMSESTCQEFLRKL